MTSAAATGYDGLSTRRVGEGELRAFLRECFRIGEHEVFVGRADRVNEDLRDVPEGVVYAAFCTYDDVAGDFALVFDLGITGSLARRVGRREFAERFAARFDAHVLYGDTEPPGLWTLILADGRRLRVSLEEPEDDDGAYVLREATAPVPGVPGVRVNEGLWRVR
ncbi:hypothetical protein AB0L00_40230 [Actinoallomurus sp. NPDC052308]|uniref:hypothetical protein n=1 Tax=Actinoallomurus sp. NPDC052308 TaxID=3155530 RepID=UPI003431F94A